MRMESSVPAATPAATLSVRSAGPGYRATGSKRANQQPPEDAMTSLDPDEARTLLVEEQTRLQQIRTSLAKEPVDGEGERDALGELSFVDQHPADVASETFEREKDMSILDNVDEQLRDVEDALTRLEDGTYGRCAMCGRDIDEERLRARPEARYCVEDQARVERGVA